MVIELTPQTFDEVADKLLHAGYSWAVGNNMTIDLQSLVVRFSRRQAPVERVDS
jgi:hypothetical protein